MHLAVKKYGLEFEEQWKEEDKRKRRACMVLEKMQVVMFSKGGNLTDHDMRELKEAKNNFIKKS